MSTRIVRITTNRKKHKNKSESQESCELPKNQKIHLESLESPRINSEDDCPWSEYFHSILETFDSRLSTRQVWTKFTKKIYFFYIPFYHSFEILAIKQ